ncbi:MAG: transporter substrate-binding domain-containing protein [Burkholderiales bacterium]|nr:transporter substrate-binding domain-containing protein [Burkholderiales bacterium]
MLTAKRLFHFALLMLCGLLAAQHASAQCKRPYAATIGLYGYNAYLDEKARPAGISVDVFNELARRSGCKLTVETYPTARVAAMGRAGMVAMGGLTRERHLADREFVPLISASTDLIIRSDLGASTIETVQEDPHVIFGVVAGLTYGNWADAFLATLPSERIDHSTDMESVHRKMAARRVDATFGYAMIYRRELDRFNLAETVRVIPVKAAPRSVGGLLFNRLMIDTDDLSLLLNTLTQMRADGTVTHIIAHYVGADLARDQTWNASRDGAVAPVR